MKAWLNLRHPIAERTEAFKTGLERLGYAVEFGCTHQPGDRDILVSWNRIREGGTAATAFEAAGRPVLITENASWGNDFEGGPWLTMARRFHNMYGMFPVGENSRWDRLDIWLIPWRDENDEDYEHKRNEVVILPQRGIGPPEIRMPSTWPQTVQGRIRNHPGRFPPAKPLVEDLRNAGKVITWGSGAAIMALMWGIKVESHMPLWIGQQDNTEQGRLAMFRRLAWAQFRMSEIRSGWAFRWLLQ